MDMAKQEEEEDSAIEVTDINGGSDAEKPVPSRVQPVHSLRVRRIWEMIGGFIA